MKLIAISLLSMACLGGAQAEVIKVENKLSTAQVDSASYTVQPSGRSVIVYVSATYSNDCFAPKSGADLASSSRYLNDTTYQISLFGTTSRICPLHFQPVTLSLEVEELYIGNVDPAQLHIYVNGKKAVLNLN